RVPGVDLVPQADDEVVAEPVHVDVLHRTTHAPAAVVHPGRGLRRRRADLHRVVVVVPHLHVHGHVHGRQVPTGRPAAADHGGRGLVLRHAWTDHPQPPALEGLGPARVAGLDLPRRTLADE